MYNEAEIELEIERLMVEIDPLFKEQIIKALNKEPRNIYIVAIASVYLNKAMHAARAVMGDEGTVDWLLAIAEGIYMEQDDMDEVEYHTIH